MADLVGGLYLVDTAEPLRLGYDDTGTRDVSFAVSSVGGLTIAPEVGQVIAVADGIVHFNSVDVGTGLTSATATAVGVSTSGSFSKAGDASGGLRIQGVAEASVVSAFQMLGYYGTDNTVKTNAGLAPVLFTAHRHDGANGLIDAAATANIVAFRGRASSAAVTRFLFDMEAKMWCVGGTSNAVYGPEIRLAATAKVRLDGSDSGDTYIHEVGANILELVAGTEGYRATTTFFGPSEDDNKDCGASGNRWNDVFASNAVIQTSDVRGKRDIRPLDRGLAFLRTLNPVAYKFKTGKRDHWGFVAQEVAASLGTLDVGLYIEPKDGSPVGLRYNELLAPTVRAVQELDARLAKMEKGWFRRILDRFRKG